MKKHRILVIMLGVILAAHAANAETMIVAGADWCPYVCTKADNPQELADNPGFIVEIVQAAFEKAGHTIHYTAPAWDQAVEHVRTGKAHAVLGAYKSDTPDFVFPEQEIARSQSCFYIKSGADWQYDGPASLEGMSLGVVEGYTYDGGELDAYIEKYKTDAARIQVATGIDALNQNVEKVAQGSLSAVLDDQFVLEYLLNAKGLSDALQQAGCLEQTELYVAFSPAVAESKAYADLLSNAITEMRASGKLQQILRKYQLLEAFWNGFDWAELTPEEQAAWGALGWNETSWQGDAEEPASEEKDWAELSAEEQAAAQNLGYTEAYWDAN
jgi:polar amino acid transport system substrate-binding protein